MSAILQLLGIQRYHPMKIKRSGEKRGIVEQASINVSRSSFANILACAVLNMETLKLCKQTEEIRRIMNKDRPAEEKSCSTCKHCVDTNECTALGLEDHKLKITPERTDCHLWEPKA